MNAPELADLLIAGRVLTADDVLLLSAATEPAWRTRERQMELRAAAILAALKATGEPTPHLAACTLERLLRRRADGRPVAPSSLQRRVDEALTRNGGKPLGWRQILRAADCLSKKPVEMTNNHGTNRQP